tara:strand:+ start:424 stop:546 length:123 start_codon:yes stop_codon:yes gene_type:complete
VYKYKINENIRAKIVRTFKTKKGFIAIDIIATPINHITGA